MKDVLQAQLAAVASKIQSAAISPECKQTMTWCFQQLPKLYAKFQQTNENRYGEEISRLVRGMLKELGDGSTASSEARGLAVTITNRLRLLHEQVGLPALPSKC